MKAENEQYAMDLIIAKVTKGDMYAFNVLIEEHKNMAFTLAFKIMKSREDAEEVAQDSFLKAYKNIKKFQGKSKFSTWLYSIVYNTALTRLRKKQLPIDNSDYIAEDNLLNYSVTDNEWRRLQREERTTYIQKALDVMRNDDRVAITLFYMNENSLNEICEITG